MRATSTLRRHLQKAPGQLAPAYLLVVSLCWAESVQGENPRLADSGTSSANRVSLNQTLSQSDIARLRAQAKGQSNAAYIAYPQLILNGATTAHMLPTQVYGQELAVETRKLQELGVQFPSPPRSAMANPQRAGHCRSL